MKKLLLILILFLFSCKTETEVVLPIPTLVDSVLEKSQKGLDSAATISRKSDSATKKTVTKVIRDIRYLNNVVEKYKQVALTSQQVVATEKVIYRIDTVYIETKKNFWGKQKTSTTIKSDSVMEVSSDSITKVVVDTLNRN